MDVGRGKASILVIWMVFVVLAGSVLASYHQPFNPPAEGVLALVRDAHPGEWRILHVLSDSCGCSQKVMQHLLARHRLSPTEQVLLVDGDEAQLPGTSSLVAGLAQQGYTVTRIAAKSIPAHTGLRGVPLLVVIAPENKVAYMGGYGPHGDGDVAVFEGARTGVKTTAFPILGCAIGSKIRRQADPIGFRY